MKLLRCKSHSVVAGWLTAGTRVYLRDIRPRGLVPADISRIGLYVTMVEGGVGLSALRLPHPSGGLGPLPIGG
jgi:hypothetical protein